MQRLLGHHANGTLLHMVEISSNKKKKKCNNIIDGGILGRVATKLYQNQNRSVFYYVLLLRDIHGMLLKLISSSIRNVFLYVLSNTTEF